MWLMTVNTPSRPTHTHLYLQCLTAHTPACFALPFFFSVPAFLTVFISRYLVKSSTITALSLFFSFFAIKGMTCSNCYCFCLPKPKLLATMWQYREKMLYTCQRTDLSRHVPHFWRKVWSKKESFCGITLGSILSFILICWKCIRICR